MVYAWHPRRGGTYWTSIRLLIGHMLGTALIFVAWFAVAWAISIFLNWCNGLRPLPVDIFKFVTKIETGLVYADASFCVVVFAGGAWRFLRDILE